MTIPDTAGLGSRIARLGLACAMVAAMSAPAGCAKAPDPNSPDDVADYKERNDPYEPANRKLFAVNAALDRNALHPVASGYLSVVPAQLRVHVHDVLSNLGNPVQLTNDVLQGKPRKAGNTFMRLVINTTAGLGGVFDVATDLGFPDHDTDFGLTLALWGVPSGPYLFLPILGPSDPRDGIAYGVNSALDPFTWLSFGGSATFGYARFGVSAVDTRARLLGATDAIDKTALDPYASYRSLYQQHRLSAIEDGRADLPATIPNWYSGRASGLAGASEKKRQPEVSTGAAPPATIAP